MTTASERAHLHDWVTVPACGRLARYSCCALVAAARAEKSMAWPCTFAPALITLTWVVSNGVAPYTCGPPNNVNSDTQHR